MTHPPVSGRITRTKFFLRLIGPVLLVFFLWKVGPKRVVAGVAETDWPLFGAAILLVLPGVILKGTRWKHLLAFFRIKMPLKNCITMYAAGLAYGGITPGQVGEFSKVFYLVERGEGYTRTITASIVDRALDIFFLGLVGISGLWIFAEQFELSSRHLSGLSFFYPVGLSAILLAAGLGWLIYRRGQLGTLTTFRTLISPERLRHLPIVFLLTVIYLVVQYATVWLCALSAGISTDFFYLIFAYSISTIVAALPITVSGIGTRDALFYFFFTQTGVPGQTCLVLSAVILGVKIANTLILFAVSRILELSSRKETA